MKTELKIIQSFFSLPVLTRFKIGKEMGLINDSYLSPNADSICADFLVKVKKENLFEELSKYIIMYAD